MTSMLLISRCRPAESGVTRRLPAGTIVDSVGISPSIRIRARTLFAMVQTRFRHEWELPDTTEKRRSAEQAPAPTHGARVALTTGAAATQGHTRMHTHDRERRDIGLGALRARLLHGARAWRQRHWVRGATERRASARGPEGPPTGSGDSRGRSATGQSERHSTHRTRATGRPHPHPLPTPCGAQCARAAPPIALCVQAPVCVAPPFVPCVCVYGASCARNPVAPLTQWHPLPHGAPGPVQSRGSESGLQRHNN